MTMKHERRKLNLPDRRQHTYEELANRLDEHTLAVETRVSRFFAKALAIFAIIGITSAVALLGFGLTLHQFKETRKAFVRDTCKAQNKRNRDTIKAFYEEALRLEKKFPSQGDQIRQSVQSNLRLINTLEPRQDCTKLSEVSVGEAKPPPPYSPANGS